MRHKISGKKLNRTSSHRAALCANLAASLIIHLLNHMLKGLSLEQGKGLLLLGGYCYHV